MTVARRHGGLIQVGLPAWIYLPAALGALFVIAPLIAILLKIDWPNFIGLITSESSRAALTLSMKTAGASTVVCVLIGVPMALVLARGQFPGQSVLRALVLLPLVLPPVVGGIALLYTFGRQGLLGAHLDLWGIRIAFSTTAVVLAQSFVSLPFLVVSLEGALRTAGTGYEHIAATLGARPTTVLRTVTLPLVLPGLLSGAVLAFARSLGEFGATLTFAGSLQGVTRTLPLEIYLQRETDADAAVALSLLLIVVAAAIVIASGTRRLTGPL
ncbi:ABC transporter permease [Mycolicibacterium sp. P9-22]|uniref:ABC transporter permease n=1 Tax=Mycolicibacterium sp. P9-22 TaxID=2024613 RepID=UPI0011EDA639|nr:ABC transporter permease [Mycolicibacterium sp. P9-22]KAA0115187.1 molybdate ABC transporter permease subunit [Mycolicibacterium sp. P9-22]